MDFIQEFQRHLIYLSSQIVSTFRCANLELVQICAYHIYTGRGKRQLPFADGNWLRQKWQWNFMAISMNYSKFHIFFEEKRKLDWIRGSLKNNWLWTWKTFIKCNWMIWWINYNFMLTLPLNLWCLIFAISLPFADGNTKEFAICRRQWKTKQNDQYN